MIVLKPEALTKVVFAPFGDVVECAGVEPQTDQPGICRTFSRPGADRHLGSGRRNRRQPVHRRTAANADRHRLTGAAPPGSELFFPLQARDWLVVVGGNGQRPEKLRAFRASGRQGINFARGVWHHPLLVLDRASLFLIVDRKGPGNNFEEVSLADERIVLDTESLPWRTLPDR